jgi:prolyl-tRNA synthetase
MGCYGIGVSRLIASVVEVSPDKDGIIWPDVIAPYSTCVITAPGKSGLSHNHLVADLQSKWKGRDLNDVIIDDRDLSFGFKMKDALLIGYPQIIVLGKSYLDRGLFEVHNRKTRNVSEQSDVFL